MIELCSPEQCTGCAACMMRCPRDAISMREDVHGFCLPVVSAFACTECGLCRAACPVLTEVPVERWDQPEVYAGWSRNDSIRTDSSSGGVFSVLAQTVMRGGGKVFAAAFDHRFKLRHREVTSNEDLHAFRGSKYLQSCVGDTYRQISSYAKRGITVMFVGTPCQVAGLHGYLRGAYTNVLMCELVCHGVPSQRSFDGYLQYLRDEGVSGFSEIGFRDRKSSGHATILTYHKPLRHMQMTGVRDYYHHAFMHNLISRKACYTCKFARLPRIGDITLGDFWGLGDELLFRHNARKGVSLVLANSPRGSEMLRKCAPELFLEERPLTEAVKKNSRICKASGVSPCRDAFLTDMKVLSVKQLVKRYRLLTPVTIRMHISSWVSQLLGVRGTAFMRAALKMRRHA